MSLYPTLEDLKVDHMMKAQDQAMGRSSPSAPSGSSGYPSAPQAITYNASLYPSLGDYMGLDLQAVVPAVGSGWAVEPVNRSVDNRMVAPITQNHVGIVASQIQPGMRQIIACKDGKGKLGVVVQGVNKGVFVSFVYENSPASKAGLRFGDQVLEINSQTVAGWSTDKAMDFLKKCPPERIVMIIRDRPFERIITMNKDSKGYVGFVFKNGKITDIAKDSSAARNGLLTEHQLIEVNGRNVVGLKDKETQQIIDREERTVTVTIMPCVIYNHVIKHLDTSMMKKHMDHSTPEI